VRRSLFAVASLPLVVAVAGCADVGGGGELPDDEELGTSAAALTAADPVSTAVAQSCSTTSVKGLATQLVQEIQCLRPGTMKRIDGIPGLALGSAVFPYLQTPAADALVAAQKARGGTIQLNSGLRTLPQQYLLYQWSQTKRCGIGLAASPGRSNHESAIAIDIDDNATWRAALQGKGFRWLGASDPVHFDFGGGGSVDLRGLSVKAFQRLWNRNHPEDKIPEDGAYGGGTESRLARAPSGGFPTGAKCDAVDTAASPLPAANVPETPDATEGAEDADDEEESEATLGRKGTRSYDDTGATGCTAAAPARLRTGGGGLVALGALLLSAWSRRRARRSAART
jgi:hypothetical protein